LAAAPGLSAGHRDAAVLVRSALVVGGEERIAVAVEVNDVLVREGEGLLPLPRLKIVTSWPRASATSTVFGPRNPVPPRMRIRFFAFVVGASEAFRPQDRPSEAMVVEATAAVSDCPRNSRRVGDT
jgi:hypothetical protein